MKRTNLKKILSSPIAEKLLLAVLLVLGAYFTSLTLDEALRERYTLHTIVFLLALVFDILFLRLLHKALKRKAIPAVKRGARRLFSSVFRRIAKLTERFSRGERKIFLEGTDERSFALETRGTKQTKTKKRLPKLSKNASARERARHAYAVFVFKKDKNISSALTPSEVAFRLDGAGEHREIFENYNTARYSEEELK